MNIKRYFAVFMFVAMLVAASGAAFAGKEDSLGLISKASDLQILAQKYNLKSSGISAVSFTKFLIHVQGNETLRKVFEYSLNRNVLIFVGSSFSYGEGYVQIDINATDFVIQEALCPCV